MKINYTLNSENYIIGYTEMPFNENLPFIEVESLEEIQLGYTQIIGGQIIQPSSEYVKIEKLKNELRFEREAECFPYINRWEMWYSFLTIEQKQELRNWYIDWLNVTETLRRPIKPTWLK